MGKILKNILICVSILYLVISLGYQVVEKGVYEEEIEILNSGETTIIDSIAGKQFTYKDIVSTNFTANLNILNSNIFIFLISLIIGGMIGLIISTKENSKVKYVLYFILGGFAYTTIWTAIETVLYCKNGIPMQYVLYRILDVFGETFTRTVISYIFIYAVIIIINIINNKMKVNQLNESLEGKTKEKRETIESKKRKEIIKIVKKTIPIVMLFVISVYVIIITRNTIILINYSKAIDEINKKDNYYYKVESTYQSEENNTHDVRELYYKDGIYLSKLEGKVVTYENTIKNEYMAISQLEKKVTIYDNKTLFDKIVNIYLLDNHIRKWQNFILAFQVNIASETCNDKNYYVIKRDNTTLYLDKETYLPKKEIIISKYTSSEGAFQSETVEEYSYSINTVEDKDIEKPDLTGYEVVKVTDTYQEIN